MWIYERKLQYPVNIKNPNPKLAQIIISQYGGLYSIRSIAFYSLFWECTEYKKETVFCRLFLYFSCTGATHSFRSLRPYSPCPQSYSYQSSGF